MSSIADELLLDVIERGAPPHERVDGAVFVARGREGAQRRMRRWRDRLAAGSELRFAEWMRRAGTDEATMLASLADVRLRDHDVLPFWGEPLSRTIAALRRGTRDPLLDGARTWLREQPWDRSVAPSAHEGMLATLRERVWRMVEPVVDFDRQSRAATAAQFTDAGESASDEWLERIARFPVLGYLLGNAELHWRTYMSEIHAHLEVDRELITGQLFAGADPGRVTAFRGDVGDRHRQGRAVALLTFERGQRAAYKPKDLRGAAAFLDLASSFGLHARAIVVLDDHAWEELIEPQPCANAHEATRYFERMGMLIRLLALLEGRDFWLDNLVARADHPVFIDLETLLQPRVAQATMRPTEALAYELLAESAVQTGAITMPTPIAPGIDAEDLGALAAPRRYLTPFRRWGTTGDERDDFSTWSHPEHAPVLDGRAVPAGAHFDELLCGYREMQRRIADRRDALLAPGAPLERLRDAPVRFIARDTWAYQKLVHRSVAPPLLVEGTERELFLAQLHRLDGAESRRNPVAVRSEIVALRDMDVPYFASLPSSDALLTVEGDELPGYFDGTAWQRLLGRMRTVGRDVPDEQLDLVRSAFALGHIRSGHAETHVTGVNIALQHPLDWLAEATALGDWILDQAITDPDGSGRTWIGLVYEPRMRISGVQPLGPDLLTGTAGLALLFADLQRLTSGQRFGDAAREALDGREPPAPAVRSEDLLGRPFAACGTTELLAELDDALDLYAEGGEEGELERAVAYGTRLWSIPKSTGSWFPQSFAADRHQLSIVWGVPAVARSFLRLVDPLGIRSLRSRPDADRAGVTVHAGESGPS